MDSSTRMTTPDSTSSGAAPRYGTRMLIRSSSTSGKTSTLIVAAAIRPLTTIRTIRRFAATGLPASHVMARFTLFLLVATTRICELTPRAIILLVG